MTLNVILIHVFSFYNKSHAKQNFFATDKTFVTMKCTEKSDKYIVLKKDIIQIWTSHIS